MNYRWAHNVLLTACTALYERNVWSKEEGLYWSFWRSAFPEIVGCRKGVQNMWRKSLRAGLACRAMPLPSFAIWLSPPLREGLACRAMPLPSLALWLSPPLRTGLACRAMPFPGFAIWLSPPLRVGLAFSCCDGSDGHFIYCLVLGVIFTPCNYSCCFWRWRNLGGGGGGVTYTFANTV